MLAALLGAISIAGCADEKAMPAVAGDPRASSATSDAGPGSGPDAGAEGSSLMVKLDDGTLRGDLAGGARRFLKIPFAKPPVGALRWKAPVPNDPWTGVRHESSFAAGCAQLADMGAPASDNEDCLYLNVWSPARAEKAPVMVWIHGGGNFSGGAGIPIPQTDKLWYDGQVFAEKQGIVVVTLQYRLGPLGFFSHPALNQEGAPTGNQGLLDQRLALQWVQKNIARFGGDPKNVTIFGESAGSADVCYQVTSPGSRNLFHRAISQSGGCTMRSVGAEQTTAVSAPKMIAYGVASGCPEGAGQLDCLREVPVAKLLENGMQPAPGAGDLVEAKWSFAAVIDGAGGFLPDAPQALFDRGEIAKVPYLLGANNDEGTTLVIRATPLADEAEYQADLEKRYGEAAPKVAALYPPSKFDGDVNLARARAIGDASLTCGTHDTARRAAKAGLNVYLYNFNMPWSLAPTLLRAGHASEISHVFGVPHTPMPDPETVKVSEAMNGYWARFAKTGDPNGSGAPAVWPTFSSDADKRLQLDTTWEVLSDFRSEECAMWREVAGTAD